MQSFKLFKVLVQLKTHNLYPPFHKFLNYQVDEKLKYSKRKKINNKKSLLRLNNFDEVKLTDPKKYQI